MSEKLQLSVVKRYICIKNDKHTVENSQYNTYPKWVSITVIVKIPVCYTLERTPAENTLTHLHIIGNQSLYLRINF